MNSSKLEIILLGSCSFKKLVSFIIVVVIMERELVLEILSCHEY